MSAVLLTSAQLRVLNFMVDYFERNDQLPSAAAMKRQFNWASENTAVHFWKALSAAGCIEKNEARKWKFTREAPPPSCDVPLSWAEWKHAAANGLVKFG